MTETVLVVDGTNLMMRAVYAAKGSEMVVGDTFTGGVVVFVKSLARHVREERPDRVVVCWDGGRSIARTAIYPAYKANRHDQPDEGFEDRRRDTKGLACEFLALSGVHHLQRPGVEADDLIAAYALRHQREGDRVVILSSDKDFLQLLSPTTHQVRLSSASTPTDRWTPGRMVEEYQCAPAGWPDVLALAGDASDNIPGVRGFGIKTAVKKLGQAGWVRDRIQDPRYVTEREQVEVNFRLVNLLDTPPAPQKAPPFEPTGPASALWGPLLDYLHRYRLETIRQRLYQGSLWRPSAVTDAVKIHPSVH